MLLILRLVESLIAGTLFNKHDIILKIHPPQKNEQTRIGRNAKM